MKFKEVTATLDRWSNIYGDRPFNVVDVQTSKMEPIPEEIDEEVSQESKEYIVTLSSRYQGRDIRDMFDGEDGEVVEALLQSSYFDANIEGIPLRKFLKAIYVGNIKDKINLLIEEEPRFLWNAVHALSDKLNVMREMGGNVFETGNSIYIMGEKRNDPLVSDIDSDVFEKYRKVMPGPRDHSHFCFPYKNINKIDIESVMFEDDFENMAFIEMLSGHPLTPIEPKYTSDFFKKLKYKGEVQYLAKILNREVGYVSAILSVDDYTEPLITGGIDESEFGDVVYLDYLSVLRSCQRKGVGSKLIETIEKRAKELGKKKIYLNTPVFNDDAISFYGSLGFREVGIIHDKYGDEIDSMLICKEI